MFNQKLILISLIFSLLMFFAGCSSKANPATPSNDTYSGQLPVGVSDRFPDNSPASGFGALGIFNLNISANETEAELTPLRESLLTDVLEVVDITNFLQLAPCNDCAHIESVNLDLDG